ncbi:hypothetical protein LTR04_004192 [Oleoguttula sp. CCFEE 6159]|nr:hypothetical protein LTR04_004192 [Oleoguttula sp. CCFEE 6159]
MCHDCLKRIFSMSVTDPQHMPPRCCTTDHIPLKHVDQLFNMKFKILWNEKYQEYTTKNRIYCPSKGCGEWIKPSHIHREAVSGRKQGKCTRCRTKVCCLCNGKWHTRRECPKDQETRKLFEIAKEKGWQRCFNCKAMVELKEGCNHMTCRCTAEFCMVCGERWKTCDCPWFNYTALQDGDRLDGWNVPQPIRALAEGIYPLANLAQPPPPPPLAPGNVCNPVRGYQEEIYRRRAQERADEQLARRLQTVALSDGHDADYNGGYGDVWGIGNGADHFMNDNFVQNAANVLTAAYGQARVGAARAMGYEDGGDVAALRRGERRRAPRPRRVIERQEDPGLPPNAFGDESVVGARGGGVEGAGDARAATASALAGSAVDQARNVGERVGTWLQHVEPDPADRQQDLVT